ncbi:hypothetical protein EYR40_010486 [Pleurotus pulmonarius]|nr:hypothetical protein EYR36_010128 [Pleurotus pulmonarius]KAF4588931.1 hypothetical protein EYR40_010486 [Pleurotus pulmonarius]
MRERSWRLSGDGQALYLRVTARLGVYGVTKTKCIGYSTTPSPSPSSTAYPPLSLPPPTPPPITLPNHARRASTLEYDASPTHMNIADAAVDVDVGQATAHKRHPQPLARIRPSLPVPLQPSSELVTLESLNRW